MTHDRDDHREGSRKPNHPSIRMVFIAIAVSWTLVIISLIIWNTWSHELTTTDIILSQARAFFRQVVMTRSWNAMHGGVYVPVTAHTPPNPYLDVPNRDVKTTDGMDLTLVNPAYMTRQLSEIASHEESLRFHITSLKPIRPANAPEAWEAQALQSFTSRGSEYSDWWKNKDQKRFFRYMAPLWVEERCLKCHRKQGYKEGDLRGGISVVIPADETLDHEGFHIMSVAGSLFSLWTFGIIGIVLSYRSIRKRNDQLEAVLTQLRDTLGEVRTLQGFIPICSSCKKVRNDRGYWEQIEHYIRDRSEAEFSHSICPECADKLYPGMKRKKPGEDS